MFWLVGPLKLQATVLSDSGRISFLGKNLCDLTTVWGAVKLGGKNGCQARINIDKRMYTNQPGRDSLDICLHPLNS